MKKILYILLMILLFSLIGCSNTPEPKGTVVSICVNESTIPDRILVAKLDEELSKIEIVVTYSNGAVEVINLEKSMLFPHDIDNLNAGGKYKVRVTYEYVTTDIVLNTFLVFPIIYTINILKPDGSPVIDTNVILTSGNNINRPLVTDLNGSCSIELNPGTYNFKIELLEKGYIYYKTDCTLDENNPSKTIKLIDVYELNEGEGTSSNPYLVNCGFYNLIFDEENITGMKYYKFTPSETAVYTIESISYSNYSNKSVDPYLIFVDKDGNYDKSGNVNSTTNVDFKYTFEAEAGKSYTFMVFISTAAEYPTNFILKIEK